MDIAPILERGLVGRAANDLEVLLRREGAAVALRRGAVRDVVEERLGRGSDHRDDVCAGERGGLRLHGVVVDVARRYDDVLERVRARTHARLVGLALGPRSIDARDRGFGRRRERPRDGIAVRAAFALVEVGRVGEALCGILDVTGAGGQRTA